MPFSFGMSALGPILVAYYYDVTGNYDLALIAMGICNLLSALMLFKKDESKALTNKGNYLNS